MRRFELKVTAHADYLTAGDTSNPLTSVTTEILAEDAKDFSAKFENFMSKIAPFHGLSTGCSPEEIKETLDRRASITNNLRDFSNKCYDMWSAIQINSKFDHWEVNLRLMAEF